jgi:Hypothetical glycosyl hydrolase family 15
MPDPIHRPCRSELRARSILSIRVISVVLTAAALFMAASTPDSGSAGTQLFAPTGTAGTHLAENLNMFSGKKIPNSSVADAIASTNDVIVAGAAQQLGGYAARMRLANPGLTILAYEVGMLSSSSSYPDPWYLHDMHGARIRTRIGNQFLMNPKSTTSYRTGGVTYAGWTDLVRHRCAAALRANPTLFDSCWIDVLGTAPLWSGYNVGGAVPVTSSGKLWTDSAWLTMTGGLGAAVQSYIGRPVMGNGLGSGPVFYTGNRLLLQYVKGGSAEAWLRVATAPITWFPSVDQWKSNVQMLIDANRAGHPVEVTVKTWTSGTTAQKQRWRQYAYATYLLANGGHSYFQFSTDHSLTPWADGTPMTALPLGAPAAPFPSASDAAWQGVFRRPFANGVVLVNPSTSSKQISLGHTYHDAWGKAYSTFTMPATSGLVLGP